ncbi:hypothetical protein EIA34_18990, partial [Escherichia coli]
MTAMPVPEGQRLTADQPLFFHETASKLASHLVVSPGCNCGDVPCWICPYISRHLLSLNPLQARCRRYSRG